MGRRLSPVLLLVVAAGLDAAGDHGLARLALLAAVPLTAVAAIAAFGECLDSRGDGRQTVQTVLSAAAVALIVLSCAIRSSAVQGVPHSAVSALYGALAVFALKAFVATAPQLRRLSELWPAKP